MQKFQKLFKKLENKSVNRLLKKLENKSPQSAERVKLFSESGLWLPKKMLSKSRKEIINWRVKNELKTLAVSKILGMEKATFAEKLGRAPERLAEAVAKGHIDIKRAKKIAGMLSMIKDKQRLADIRLNMPLWLKNMGYEGTIKMLEKQLKYDKK